MINTSLGNVDIVQKSVLVTLRPCFNSSNIRKYTGYSAMGWCWKVESELKSRIRDPVENKPLPSVTSVYLIPRFHVDTPTGLQQHFSMFGQCSDNGGCPNKSNQLWKKTAQWADTSRTKNRLIMTNTELGKRCPCPEVNFCHFPCLLLTLAKYENALDIAL